MWWRSAFDAGINAAENWLAGRKSISEGTGGAALRGCLSGLIGAHVWFLAGDEAPQHVLMPGARFELMQGWTVVARGTVLTERLKVEAPAAIFGKG